MRSVVSSPPRLLLLLLAASSSALVALTACGTSEYSGPTPGTPGTGGPIGTGDGGGLPPLGDGSVVPTGPGSVVGNVLGRASRQPVAGRQLKVRDATGKTLDLVTDGSGNFSASGVASPYDIWLAPSGAGLQSWHAVYLGLRATTLKIFADTTETPAPPPNAATVKITWTNPACGGSCEYMLVLRTPDGSINRGHHPGKAPGSTFTLDAFPMTWYGADTTQVEIGLLLAGTDGTTHHFATQATSLTKGQLATVTLTPASVPTLGAATLTASPAAPAGFAVADGKAFLQLPGAGGSIAFVPGPTPYTFRVPSIAGSTLSFASTQYKGTDPVSVLGGTRVGVAPAAGAHTIELGEPFPVAAPASGGTISVATGSIDFHAVAGPRFRLVNWTAPDRPGFVAVLGDEKLIMSRVAALVAVAPGTGELLVEEHARGLDEYVGNVFADVTGKYATSSFPATMLK